MTPFEKLSLAFGAVQAVAIIVSIAALWWQLKQFNENMKYDAYSKHVDDYSRVSELLIEHPEMDELYFSEQPDVLQMPQDKRKFYNFIALVLGYYERLHLLKFKRECIEDATWKTWENWLTGQWLPIPMFYTFWQNERAWFNPDFQAYIDKTIAAYRASKKTPG